MVVMFNENSFVQQISLDLAKEMMKTFVDTYIGASKSGISEIRLHQDFGGFYPQQIAPNYFISQWVDDINVDKPLRTRFRSIAVKSPLIIENEIQELDDYSSSEFSIQVDEHSCPCSGLGAAYVCDTLAFSFNSHSLWNNNNVSVNHFFIDNELNETTRQREVKHFSTTAHFNTHLDWVLESQQRQILNGQEFWQKKEQMFPFLTFCGETEGQFCNKGYSGKLLNQIIDRLQSLNKIAEAWKNNKGGFNYDWANNNYDVRISLESETTMNKFSQERRFQLPDKTYEIFELHLKTGNLRFHFFPDNNTQNIYIGYIGKHLQTSSD